MFQNPSCCVEKRDGPTMKGEAITDHYYPHRRPALHSRHTPPGMQYWVIVGPDYAEFPELGKQGKYEKKEKEILSTTDTHHQAPMPNMAREEGSGAVVERVRFVSNALLSFPTPACPLKSPGV